MAIRNLSDIPRLKPFRSPSARCRRAPMRLSSRARSGAPSAKALSFFLFGRPARRKRTSGPTPNSLRTSHARRTLSLPGVSRPIAPSRSSCPTFPRPTSSIWGGEAAGAALAINPMLEPKLIANLLRVAHGLGPGHAGAGFEPKAWSDLVAELGSLSDLQNDRVCRHGRLPRRTRSGRLRAPRSTRRAARAGLKVVNLREAMRETAFRSSDQRPRYPRRRHLVLLLHRRDDRRTEDCGADASERGFRCVGLACKRWRPTACREPFSAACPCFT